MAEGSTGTMGIALRRRGGDKCSACVFGDPLMRSRGSTDTDTSSKGKREGRQQQKAGHAAKRTIGATVSSQQTRDRPCMRGSQQSGRLCLTQQPGARAGQAHARETSAGVNAALESFDDHSTALPARSSAAAAGCYAMRGWLFGVAPEPADEWVRVFALATSCFTPASATRRHARRPPLCFGIAGDRKSVV